MNKQTLIIITVLGLGIGSFIGINSFSNSSDEGMEQMTMNSDHKHGSHDMMKESHKSSMRKTMPLTNYKESLSHYFSLQKALANDSLEHSHQAAKKMATTLGEDHSLTTLVHSIHHSSSLEEARSLFESLSQKIETLIKHRGIPDGMTIEKYHCPMVDNNRGASWLQDSKGTKNPYYGADMPHCGSKVGTL